jgi:hypothetical protein
LKCRQEDGHFREWKIVDRDVDERRGLECKTARIDLVAKAITVADVRIVAFGDTATTSATATFDLATSSPAFGHLFPPNLVEL